MAGERLYNPSGKWNKEHNSFVEKYEYLEKNHVKYISTAALQIGTNKNQNMSCLKFELQRALLYSSL
jgi:hypothetical protein